MLALIEHFNTTTQTEQYAEILVDCVIIDGLVAESLKNEDTIVEINPTTVETRAEDGYVEIEIKT